jgi:hypothetical protein
MAMPTSASGPSSDAGEADGRVRQELAGAVERPRKRGRRSPSSSEIAGSIDMDEVLARTLQAGIA